jgi:heat shock protein HslJ
MRTTTRSRRRVRALLIVGAITLLAAGCGDDGGSDTAPTDTDSTDTGSTDTDSTDTGATDRGPDLVGDWTITSYQLAGALGEAEPLGPDPVTISFGDDGTFTFSTGCNTGEGEWEAWGAYYVPEDEDDDIPEGQGIEFDGISVTEIDCDEDRADQDLSIGGAIRAAMRFTVGDGSFTLLRDGNVMLAGESG